MQKRNTQQRRRAIIEKLKAEGEVSVELLAKENNTSEVTIRKDLSALEANGLLLRKYGGAVPLAREQVLGTGEEQVSKRKLAIAKAAAWLIRDHNRIIVDSGQTTACLLPELCDKQGLIVMTNSLEVANALRELENEPTLLMTGGTWDQQSEAFQGQLAEQVLRAYNFDQLFIGADGIDPARGTTTYNELYTLSRVMAEVAREVIVMAESEKLGRKIHNLELGWEEIDTLVTDDKLPVEIKHQIQSQGVRVICAKLEKETLAKG
ncbi:DeoR/GlpR family DNA-binding transcription regulator [Teredinibacter waterburyi]|uniref:DeoR/GlpR family DNA-binding transcription regulator n=1 Tax=Teredinibacter waterburyi TaxID=1500538 RepID=UPI00165FF887|nr:DeoR family transcriptional regulator [Teredinibacter waterburyi]